MGLGDVGSTTVPKLTLPAPPRSDDGAVTTRTFVPVRCHTSIGVLGTAGVAAGIQLVGSVGEGIGRLPGEGGRVRIKHPTGFFDLEAAVDRGSGEAPPAAVRRAAVRTARRISDGTVFPRPVGPAPAAARPASARHA
jgi:4-oxalomesaconate tautomerase